jgi:hypothetical protein
MLGSPNFGTGVVLERLALRGSNGLQQRRRAHTDGISCARVSDWSRPISVLAHNSFLAEFEQFMRLAPYSNLVLRQ